jgi:hypothetical protein
MSGVSVLAQVGAAYVLDFEENTCPGKLEILREALNSFLNGKQSVPFTAEVFRATIGSSKPFDRILAIVQTTANPIPDFSILAHQERGSRKVTRSWTDYENQRLLAGIFRFGTDNWPAVAAFVGNGRTRAQCAQRWIRGLDPRISKERWTPEDGARLAELVARYGTKSWSRIAAEMGNRSDVQCRYHYSQMTQDRPQVTISPSLSVPIGLLVHNPTGNPTQRTFPTIKDLLNPQPLPVKSSESMGVLPVFLPGSSCCRMSKQA